MSWRPASGYLTKSGKAKWRCWNESNPVGQKEYAATNGKRRLFDSYGAAIQACAMLNKAHANGAPKFDYTGMMLDDQGNRSIFDDIDK